MRSNLACQLRALSPQLCDWHDPRKFSENWLRELVDLPVDRPALVHRRTMPGLAVDGIKAAAAALERLGVR